jgi:uncharacterized membrane protein
MPLFLSVQISFSPETHFHLIVESSCEHKLCLASLPIFIQEYCDMMNVRFGILELARRRQLDASALASLWKLSRLGEEPVQVLPSLRRGLGYMAGLLGGLGLIFLVAANWKGFGRAGQFFLLELWTFSTCVGAAFLHRARSALALLALLSIGALFAFYGQTYQTGADPWQLFALWAALALPLALAARSDVVWVAWIVVAMTAVGTWCVALNGWSGHGDVTPRIAAMAMSAGLCALTWPGLRSFSGAGTWSFHLAFVLAASFVTLVGIAGVLGDSPGSYLISLLILGGAAMWFAQPSRFNIVVLAILAFGLNVLLIVGIGRMLSPSNEPAVILTGIVLGGGGLLSTTAWALISLNQQHGKTGGAQ